MKTLTLLSRTTLLAVALIGCGTDAITLGELIEAVEDGNPDSTADDGPRATDEPPPEATPSEPTPSDEPPPESAPSEPTPYTEAEAVRILLQYCGECHAGDAFQGDFGNIDDIDSMIALGLIIPADKEDSRIYARMLGQSMPPVSYDEQPSYAEIVFIGEFIDRLPVPE